jgi:two-component system sensor histidine kinase UhpB
VSGFTVNRVSESLFHRWARPAFAVPLFWKILVANTALAVGAVVVGWELADHLVTVRSAVAAGVALTVTGMALNAVILRLALEPLDLLERAAKRVQDGDLDSRAPQSPLADPALRRLARTFNAALDALADSRRRVRLLLARSIEEEEGERRRVARALEDDAAQRLAGLLMQLRLLERKPDPASLVELVEKANEEIVRALEVVREYATSSRPAVLEELGVIAALEADARRIMGREDLRVRFEGSEPKRLSLETVLLLYRVVREALENAARHASARSILVSISNGGGSVVAIVEDDGQGFDLASAAKGPGLGLTAMRECTESAGGSMSVWSAPGRGSRVRFEIPLPPREESVCRS